MDTLAERVAEILSTESDDPLRDRLLKHYAERKPTKFYQLDGFCDVDGDGGDIPPVDEEGDCITGGKTHELMRGADVRVLVKAGTNPKAAVRLMKKLSSWLECQTERLLSDSTYEIPF